MRCKKKQLLCDVKDAEFWAAREQTSRENGSKMLLMMSRANFSTIFCSHQKSVFRIHNINAYMILISNHDGDKKKMYFFLLSLIISDTPMSFLRLVLTNAFTCTHHQKSRGFKVDRKAPRLNENGKTLLGSLHFCGAMFLPLMSLRNSHREKSP
jgi:hypothetical protein